MKINRLAIATFAAMAGIALSTVSSAQAESTQTPTDSVVAVVADAEGLSILPPEQVPPFGTFWSARNTFPFLVAPAPCPPLDQSYPIYVLSDGIFLVDETGGEVVPQSNARAMSRSAVVSSVVQRQADELMNFIDGMRERLLSRSSLTMSTMDASGPPAPGEGGYGTNDWGGGFQFDALTYTTNDLWLELITKTNSTGYFVLHPPWSERLTGIYDLFQTTNLSVTVPGLNGTNWLWIYRTTTPGQTNLTIPGLTADESYFRAARTNDTDGDGMSDAYERLCSHTNPNSPDAPQIVFQPLSQTVDRGDTITFNVTAQGPSPLRYQWLLGGTTITGETNDSLVFASVQSANAGTYSVRVTSPVGLYTVSSNAALTVQNPTNWPVIKLTGARQNYTFKNGSTYYCNSRVELYGTTTIEGGATIKPDRNYTNSTFAVMGTLVCKTDDAYFPAYLTSIDDNSVGNTLQFSSGNPVTANSGSPYLDLTSAQDPNPTLNNLRIRYANQGISTPTTKQLDVWNCQFVACNSGIVARKDATISLHNVLFGTCGSAIAGSTNFTAIQAEQITAQATNFWSQTSPTRISLTNSIIVGTLASGPTLTTNHVAINPAGSVFQRVGAGYYYLTNTSSYRKAGITNISSRLASEFQRKTTQPPIVFPAMIQISDDLVLGLQAERYTNGAPDYGYYYAALDYTVASLTNHGKITILPGTAVGLRNDFLFTNSQWTTWGFDLREGSSFISQGMPTRPNTFVDVQLVQEQLAGPCVAAFVPDFWPTDEKKIGPFLDFRFSNFYANSRRHHIWSGYDMSYDYLYSPDSRVNLNMQDCKIYGGRITLGQPDDGSWYGAPPDWVYGECAVFLINNLFENVSIDLDPTFYQYGYGLNCDMTFEAYNNLFKGGLWFHLQPIPASAGNWVFKDNLFDKVDFIQNTNAPLDFNYNGYWPLSASEQGWAWYYYPWNDTNSARLLTTVSGGGGNEQIFTFAPPYQNGPLGSYYLPTTTSLYHAGSRTFADAGLAQFTTRLDQTKESGEAPSGHNVNIGLHYVATTNAYTTLPKDSDGDGIPDFIEDSNGNDTVDSNETSPLLAQTVSGILDATNSVYDDIDLSGDGLVGRIKKALGISAFDSRNPLSLTRKITGEEPDIATFQIPISYNLLTNVGTLQLRVDSKAVEFQELRADTNGNCLLSWNTTFDSPGLHFPQVQLTLARMLRRGSVPDTTIATGAGQLLPFSSDNVCQFNPFYAEFDSSGATLYARTPACPDAEYVIELKTLTGSHIRSFTNVTSTGVISEFWDLKYDNGNTCTNKQIDAIFKVTLLDPATGTNKFRLIGDSEYILDGNFTVAYAWDNGTMAQGPMRDCIQWGVVDELIKPTWAGGENDNPYSSTFNDFSTLPGTGIPGYLQAPSSVPPLLTNLGDFFTRNFHFDGHGNPIAIGDDKPMTDPTAVGFAVSDLVNVLDNTFHRWGPERQHPYRFVFLNACETADDHAWARAFGVLDRITSTDLSAKPWKVQAYVGWEGSPRGPDSSDEWYDEAEMYAVFYGAWMNGSSLDQCIQMASSTHPFGSGYPLTLDFPLGIKFSWWDSHKPINRSSNNFRIRVYGYAGIKRTGYESGHDSSPNY